MSVRHLTLPVPSGFAEIERQRKLLRISMLVLMSFGMSWWLQSDLFAVFGYVLVARLLIILAFLKSDLIYDITPQGVSITVAPPIAGALMRLAFGFRMGWPTDTIVTVEHRYYGDHSVVLLRRKASDEVYYLPVAPSDVNIVADYLLTHDSSQSDDQNDPTSIK